MKEIDYHIEDFTEENFKAIIEQLICLGYKFVGFDYNKIKSNENIVLWRHDVDISLNRAYKLAEIEAKEGIKATYFIYIQSSFYNIFEPAQFKKIEKIIDRGHMIGLHFDHSFYVQDKHIIDNSEIEQYAIVEKEILEQYFNISVNTVSFHNPEASNVLDLKQDYYAGMVNAYSKTIGENCKYCSDSNGYWRYDRLQDVINGKCGKKYKKLHILTHPVWWTPYEMFPYERVERCVNGRRNTVIREYSNILEQNGRKNIGL